MKILDNYLIGIAVIFGLAGSFLAGAKLGYLAGDAKVARLVAERAAERASTQAAARLRLQAAQERGDALETRLNKAESARQIQSQENAREIHRLAAGRPCLGGAVVRLLNQSRPGSEPGPMPEAAGQPAAADAAFATDTDIGLWIDGAIGQYAQCRARLQALIDWHIPEAP